MKLQVSRNIQFTRLVKADGRLHEFNFRKLYALHEGMFNVDVADDRGNRIIFKMQKNDTAWKILDEHLPLWVTEVETQLSDVIEDTMSHETYKHYYLYSYETI
jgi:hypothetical protein